MFGGVINGFQRYDLNNIVGTASSIVDRASSTSSCWWPGYGLVELVVAMTAVRRADAAGSTAPTPIGCFPGCASAPSLFRRERLREVTGFSIHMALIDWANKLNYSVDALVIGAFLNTQRRRGLGDRAAARRSWRSAWPTSSTTSCFPPWSRTTPRRRLDRLQRIFVEGTRLSLATVVPLSGAMLLLARPLVTAWVGPDFAAACSSCRCCR